MEYRINETGDFDWRKTNYSNNKGNYIHYKVTPKKQHVEISHFKLKDSWWQKAGTLSKRRFYGDPPKILIPD